METSKDLGERFDEEKLRNARVDFPPRYKGELVIQPLRVNSSCRRIENLSRGLVSASFKRLTVNGTLRGEPC